MDESIQLLRNWISANSIFPSILRHQDYDVTSDAHTVTSSLIAKFESSSDAKILITDVAFLNL